MKLIFECEGDEVKVKVKCFRVPDASARMEPELNPDFPPLEKALTALPTLVPFLFECS